MFSRFTKVLLSTVALCSVFCTDASAQNMEDFKARMSAAATYMKEDATEALRQYLEIRVQYAGPEVDYSLGRAYQRLYQCHDAQHYYTQVMIAYELQDTNPIYKRATQAYDEIAPCASWQKVRLTCDMPAGGYVMLNDERIGSCWDRSFSLPDGEHVFKLVAPGGKTKEVKFKAQQGKPDAQVDLKLDINRVEVERIVEVEKAYVYEEKFSPVLYWSLIAGGLALAGVGAGMTGLANAGKFDAEKALMTYYRDLNALKDEDKKKQEAVLKKTYEEARDKASSKESLGNALMYTFIGVGAATAVTGAVFAIMNLFGEKELVEVEKLNAYVSPTDSGVSMGFSMRF